MVDIPSSLLHPDNYVLQVKGNSMIDEQIHDKDYIVARKTNTARSGQIVVALINGEATLKYIFMVLRVWSYIPETQTFQL